LVLEAKAISQPPSKQMSLAGVGEATLGAALANTAKTLFTKEENKPATKGDINALAEKLQGRYHLVKNMDRDQFGRYPYYDLYENVIIYLK
jgi:hypothetical protein